ncbi:hypothetical protein PLICRDRAFT_112652 [Plicaturopsis crispa FD-325 SS-3]|nr:hypothetical protein PLICRDRAFT_112652 [Plicaturopsis crispa FD-325 SS-3]
MSSSIVYLVTGANRGIGLGIVQSLVLRENVIIFAGARDVEGAKDLQALAKQYPGKFHIVKLVSASKEDSEAAAALVEKVAGHIDIIIANAGIADTWATAHEVPISEVERHFKVNAVGPLVLFQAFYPLLQAAPGIPKFAFISTFGGSIESGAASPLGLSAYGPSKAALNFLSRKIHFENERLVSFAIHPGAVDTDAWKEALRQDPKLSILPVITIEESARGVLARVDESTREKSGGTFVGWEGDNIAW